MDVKTWSTRLSTAVRASHAYEIGCWASLLQFIHSKGSSHLGSYGLPGYAFDVNKKLFTPRDCFESR